MFSDLEIEVLQAYPKNSHTPSECVDTAVLLVVKIGVYLDRSSVRHLVIR